MRITRAPRVTVRLDREPAPKTDPGLGLVRHPFSTI